MLLFAGNLTQLERLPLSNNQLEVLPQTLGRLRLLKELRLSHNKLREIPNIVTFLPLLERLYLDHNELIEIPTSVGKLKSLRELVVSYNALSDIPTSITRITSLEKLDVTNNPNLKRLPQELLRANIKNLALVDARSGSPKMSIGSVRIKSTQTDMAQLTQSGTIRGGVSQSPSKPRVVTAGYVHVLSECAHSPPQC